MEGTLRGSIADVLEGQISGSIELLAGEPVLDDITITENGHYTPPSGVDGYDDITVNVPTPQPVLDDITINENGHFTPPSGVDGYDDITVYVPYVTQGITINENGTYTPHSGVDGFGRVIVDVPTPPPSLQSLNASHNGYFLPSSGYVGFSDVTVDVALPQNAYLLESYTGDIITFDNGVLLTAEALTADITPIQSGSGDPSPSNVRPITGYTNCTITVKDDLTTPTVTQTYTVNFTSSGSPITVYSGVLDVINGILTIDRVCENITTVTRKTNTNRFVFPVFNNMLLDNTDEQVPASTFVCNCYKMRSIRQVVVSGSTGLAISSTSNGFYLYDPDLASLTEQQMETYLSNNPIQVLYPLENEIVLQLDKTLVKTILGANKIYSNTGNITIQCWTK